ncbi:MAG TPA: sugar ABC transporter permease [Atribacteraceae bacterium]|nr:sugar ABC transporter permease [Atribacteraceae bacterium]
MNRIRAQAWREHLFLLPVLSFVLLIFAYPYIRTFLLAFYNVSFGARESYFVGLGNFQALLRDLDFWSAIGRSFTWAAGNLLVQMTVPIGIALLLNRRMRGIHLARALVMLPWIVPSAAIAVCLRWMLLPRIGMINQILLNTGLMDREMHFLGSSATAMPTLILINSWKFLPFGTLLILSALQSIPESVFESAAVDGARGFQMFRYITFPLLGSMIWFVGFVAFAWNFNIFDLIWLTTQGGPGSATETLPVLIYRTAFRTFRLGEASAMAVFVAILLLIVGIVYFRVLTPKK